uniref:Lipid binding protein n=1 Tax=Rhizophora mucronata TaxID=61149 RepID=A0A2P2Q351_RHIMU
MARSVMLPLILSALHILSLWNGVVGAGHHHHSAAPSPSVDCSNLILDMTDCLSFVTQGSTIAKPEGNCCSGLKTVLSTDAQCLCEAFKNSAQLGVSLNVTKALTLPATCKLHAPSVSTCALTVTPAGAPAPASSIAGVPTASAGGLTQAPAPSPNSSGSHGLAMSVGSLVFGLIVALFSSF